MKSGQLINYVRKRLVSVEKHLAAYRDDRESERLHLLRIDIKKIKAVFSLFGYIHSKKYTDSGLRTLFHEAGAIREIEIYLLLLVSIPALPENFILQLEKEKKKRKDRFQKNIPGYIKHVRNIMERIPLPVEILHNRSVIKYFKTEMQKVKKRTNTENRKDMHRLRMRLKKLVYLYDSLPGKIQDRLDLNKDHINRLQRIAGDWHDTYSSIDFLSRQRIAGNMSEYISDLKRKEEKQFKSLTKSLNKKELWIKKER